MGNGSLNAQKKIRTICWIPLAPGQLPLAKEKKDHAKESKRLFLFPSLMDSSSRNIRENRRRGTPILASCIHCPSLPPKWSWGSAEQTKKRRRRNWTRKARVEIAALFFLPFFVGKEFGLMPRFVFTCQLCKCSGEEGGRVALLHCLVQELGGTEGKRSRNLD